MLNVPERRTSNDGGEGKDELAEDKHPIDREDEIFLFTLCH